MSLGCLSTLSVMLTPLPTYTQMYTIYITAIHALPTLHAACLISIISYLSLFAILRPGRHLYYPPLTSPLIHLPLERMQSCSTPPPAISSGPASPTLLIHFRKPPRKACSIRSEYPRNIPHPSVLTSTPPLSLHDRPQPPLKHPCPKSHESPKRRPPPP